MRKRLYFPILAIALLPLAFAGCHFDNDDDDDRRFEAVILSDQPADGDIAWDPVREEFTVTMGPDVLFFGIDDGDPNLPEYRAFLDFPLDGSTGFDSVPEDARIVSATMELFIESVSFARVVPTLIDLIVYPIAALEPMDFDSPPLATILIDFLESDEGRFVAIDVTPLMREAQRRGLADFQVRLLLDIDEEFGFVGIEDLPRVTARAPLLNVIYRH